MTLISAVKKSVNEINHCPAELRYIIWKHTANIIWASLQVCVCQSVSDVYQ